MIGNSDLCAKIEELSENFKPHVVSCSTLRCHGPWEMRFSSKPELLFGIVTAGFCRMETELDEVIPIGEGDFLLASTISNIAILGPSKGARGNRSELIAKGSPATAEQRFPRATTTYFLAGHAAFPVEETALAHAFGSGLIVRSDAASKVKLTLACLEEESHAVNGPSTRVQQALVRVLLAQTAGTASLRLAAASRFRDLGSSTGIASAIRSMRSNLTKDWTVATLAAVAFMSRSTFARKFEQTVGMPPQQYLRELRMARARHALLGGRSIKSTAAIVGFRSDKAFRTAFRIRFGESPDKFRRTRSLDVISDCGEPKRDTSEPQQV